MHSAERKVISLAWPIASAMLGEVLMGVVDTKLVGRLGSDALGAVGVSAVLFYVMYFSLVGALRGIKIRTANLHGADRLGATKRYLLFGIGTGTLIGWALCFCLQGITTALPKLGFDPALVPGARDFLWARAWGLPALGGLAAMVEHRQGLGDTRTPMFIGLGGNVINAALAYGLISGHFGLPALGVLGAGLATALTGWAQVLTMGGLVILWLRRTPSGEDLPTWREVRREVTALGIPGAMHTFCEMSAYAAFVAILASSGAVQMAAHQIAITINRATFLPGIAFGEAACILVAQQLGRGSLDGADRVTRAAIKVAMVFMVSCGIAFVTFGRSLGGLFTDDPECMAILLRILRVVAVFQVLDACNLVLRGALRGAQQVRSTAVIGVIVIWLCTPPAALILGRWMGLGVLGGWMGFVGETGLCAALFAWRWRRGAWRRQWAVDGPLSERLAA